MKTPADESATLGGAGRMRLRDELVHVTECLALDALDPGPRPDHGAKNETGCR